MYLIELNKLASNHFNRKCILTSEKPVGKVKIDKNVWRIGKISTFLFISFYWNMVDRSCWYFSESALTEIR